MRESRIFDSSDKSHLKRLGNWLSKLTGIKEEEIINGQENAGAILKPLYDRGLIDQYDILINGHMLEVFIGRPPTLKRPKPVFRRRFPLRRRDILVPPDMRLRTERAEFNNTQIGQEKMITWAAKIAGFKPFKIPFGKSINPSDLLDPLKARGLIVDYRWMEGDFDRIFSIEVRRRPAICKKLRARLGIKS